MCVTETEKSNFEQRCLIKFCVKLGETGIETFHKLKQTYGEHALSRSQVFKWYKAFSEGRESIKDEPHSGRPSTSKMDNKCGESVSPCAVRPLNHSANDR